MQTITSSEQATFDFARDYAGKLKGGEVIGLIGELGAGKTVFTKGIAAGLGITETVTSPTFVLMKIYPVTGQKHIERLVHVDAYRIAKPEELINIGLEDYFNNESVVIIEWADKVEFVLPKKSTTYVKLKTKINKSRIIKY